MNKSDPLVALARQQRLSAAARGAVGGCFPAVTAVDAGLPLSRSCKTNPIAYPAAPAASMDAHGAAAVRSAAPAVRDAVFHSSVIGPARGDDRGLPPVTLGDRRSPTSPFDKTNPIQAPAPAALSPRQLAAARMLARAQTVADVASALRVSRQGLWKWRRLPAFVAELARLHELLARQPESFGRIFNRETR